MKDFQKYHIDDNVLLVHKPIGISSFDLVARMRKFLGTRKVGHAGTLDPLASGLMIIAYNSGTKKINNYVGLDKTYLAEIIIGVSTTTGDREGKVIDKKNPYKNDVSLKNCEEAFDSLLGEHYFPAPLYSAVKVGGKSLYKYARENQNPPFIPQKKMELKKYTILDIYKSGDIMIVKVRVKVGSGTYIRTLAEEFGKKLHYPASLKNLYRVAIDNFYDKDSLNLDDKKKNFCDTIKVYSLIKEKICRFFFKQKK